MQKTVSPIRQLAEKGTTAVLMPITFLSQRNNKVNIRFNFLLNFIYPHPKQPSRILTELIEGIQKR